MAPGAEPGKGGGGGTFGLAIVGSNYWIIIDPSCGSKCSSGAQHAVDAKWRRAVDLPPRLGASKEEPPTVVESFDSKGGPLAGNEARLRESHGDDKRQAREARKKTSPNLITMDHCDVEADAALWHQPEPL